MKNVQQILLQAIYAAGEANKKNIDVSKLEAAAGLLIEKKNAPTVLAIDLALLGKLPTNHYTEASAEEVYDATKRALFAVALAKRADLEAMGAKYTHEELEQKITAAIELLQTREQISVGDALALAMCK